MSGESPIPQFYHGRQILVTGATGFMGKVLVEKLLRCCPDIDKIYLLMRPKKGQDPTKRLDELLNTPVSWLCKRFFIFVCASFDLFYIVLIKTGNVFIFKNLISRQQFFCYRVFCYHLYIIVVFVFCHIILITI